MRLHLRVGGGGSFLRRADRRRPVDVIVCAFKGCRDDAKTRHGRVIEMLRSGILGAIGLWDFLPVANLCLGQKHCEGPNIPTAKELLLKSFIRRPTDMSKFR